MPAASYRASSYRAGRSLRGRAASVALALALGVLVILALLRMGGLIARAPGNGRPLSTFDVLPPAREERAASARRTVAPKRERATRAKAPAQEQRRTAPPPSPAPEESLANLRLPGVIQLSSAEFRASDIGRIKGAASAEAASGDAAAGESDAAIGTGPGGEPMYAAEWYREPRHAELSPYMPPNTPGWGMVACRTIDRFHVEDCRELGETPGSGIARGVRQAAWQFLVRPPRKGGRPLIGAWVRIRIDLSARKE